MTELKPCPFLSAQQALVVLAYAKHSMDARAVAKGMGVSDGAIHYHLRIIEEQTGRNPRNFYDLCWLVGIAANIVCAFL